jgi:hypothetical protein
LFLALAFPANVRASGPVPGFLLQGDPRFWSLGAAGGSSFAAPFYIATLQGTISPYPYIIVEPGFDLGFSHGYPDEAEVHYFSLYPFVHLNGYIPLGPVGGFYGGTGGGLMLAFYTYEGERRSYTVPALDLTAGLYVGEGRHYMTIAYTFRTDFGQANHKVSLGYSYRFRVKEGPGE